MSSPTIAVVGAASVEGRAILPALTGLGSVVAIDAVAPGMPPATVEVKVMDPRDALLPLALDGVDVLVHAAFDNTITASSDALYGRNVGGTRNVLAAASKAGITRVVMVSSATVYGAHADNPVPLPESAPARANPGYAHAYQRLLAEELLGGWAHAHPASQVTVLRVAPLLGHTGWDATRLLLTGPCLALPGTGQPLWQFACPEDVATAVAQVVAEGLTGTFNVAADGWLTTQEVADALGTRVIHVGQTTLAEVLRLADRFGAAPAPAAALPYLTHPWVMDNGRLRATGWRPTSTNRELLADVADRRRDVVTIGVAPVPRQLIRRVGYVGAAALGLLVRSLIRRSKR